MRQNFDADAFMKAIRVDKDDPHPGLADNAALLAFYGTQQGLWEGQVAYNKMVLENQEAVAREEMRVSGEKYTAPQADAIVANNEEVKATKKALTVAKMQDALYTNACKALHDRGNNLRSIGTWLRSEKSFTVSSFSDEAVSSLTKEEKRSRINSLGKS